MTDTWLVRCLGSSKFFSSFTWTPQWLFLVSYCFLLVFSFLQLRYNCIVLKAFYLILIMSPFFFCSLPSFLFLPSLHPFYSPTTNPFLPSFLLISLLSINITHRPLSLPLCLLFIIRLSILSFLSEFSRGVADQSDSLLGPRWPGPGRLLQLPAQSVWQGGGAAEVSKQKSYVAALWGEKYTHVRNILGVGRNNFSKADLGCIICIGFNLFFYALFSFVCLSPIFPFSLSLSSWRPLKILYKGGGCFYILPCALPHHGNTLLTLIWDTWEWLLPYQDLKAQYTQIFKVA